VLIRITPCSAVRRPQHPGKGEFAPWTGAAQGNGFLFMAVFIILARMQSGNKHPDLLGLSEMPKKRGVNEGVFVKR